MKHTYWIAILFMVCTSFLTSCSVGPKYMEEEDLLKNVYEKTHWETICLYWRDSPRPTEEDEINGTQVIDWVYNEQTIGNTYQGYFVTYSVDMVDTETTYYALVDLVEFDDGRYEWSVIDVSSSLSDIQSNLY